MQTHQRFLRDLLPVALLLILERAANRGAADNAEWFEVPGAHVGTRSRQIAAGKLSEVLDPFEHAVAKSRHGFTDWR